MAIPPLFPSLSWTSTIHDEVVIDNWTNQPYQVRPGRELWQHCQGLVCPVIDDPCLAFQAQENHGTNITEVNNTVIPAGQPFPPAAQAIINAAGRWSTAGPKNLTC